MNVESERQYQQFCVAVRTLNDLFRKKYICEGVKISSVFFLCAIIVLLSATKYFTTAYCTVVISGVAYYALARYVEYINEKILAYITTLQQFQGRV